MTPTPAVWIVGIIVIFAIVAISFYGQEFAVVREVFWLPNYLTVECIEKPGSMATRQILEHRDGPRFYHCNTDEAVTWIPQKVPGIQCEYTISGHLQATVYICDGLTERLADIETNKCVKQRSLFSGDIDTYTVKEGDSIYIDTFKVIRDAQLFAKYPSYWMRIRQADLFVRNADTCLLSNVGTEIHTVDAENAEEVSPLLAFNAVSQLAPAISNQVVSLSFIRGGETIYITRPGYYALIKTTDDGFKYADLREEIADNKIQCIPRTTGCDDDAQIIPLDQQSCDQYGGAVIGYSPVAGQPGKQCRYECSDGQLQRTSDCVTVPSSCPDDAPTWSPQAGKCIGLSSSGGVVSSKFDLRPIFIIAIILAIVIIILLIAKRKGKI